MEGQTRAQDGYRPVVADAVRPLAALVLTGGASRRMGTDKAAILVDGVPLAARTASLLSAVADPVLEVGPGRTTLPAVADALPGEGPLAALAAGADVLTRRGHRGPALVVATDLPRLTTQALVALASHPATGSVVPVVAGRPQWLCARWSAGALAAADRLVASGERRIGALASVDVTYVEDPSWAGELADVDTPEDLVRLGVRP